VKRLGEREGVRKWQEKGGDDGKRVRNVCMKDSKE
jgi:hypothetical protein